MGLLGNPVAQDMEDAVRLLPHRNIYSVQLVLTSGKELVAAHVGDLGGTFRAAVKDATDLYSVSLSRRGNIVVTANPHPMDINLYQSQHAMETGWLALEPPGVLVLVSKCRDGVGSDAFLDHFDELRRRGPGHGFTREEYRLGMHKASRVMAMKREARIFAVTGLGPDVVERAGMRPFGDVQEALDAAVSHVTGMGAEPRTIFLPYGGTSVPIISGNNAE
jgi:nickel-dependent lactate racemase